MFICAGSALMCLYSFIDAGTVLMYYVYLFVQELYQFVECIYLSRNCTNLHVYLIVENVLMCYINSFKYKLN